MPLTDVQDELRAWFASLADCVQRVDFAAARPLFVEEAIGFGTKASLAVGRDALEANQWRGIWPNIRDFRFNLDDMRCATAGDQAWAVVTWTSTGFDPNGQPFDRPGRATVIFVRRHDAWRALHSHFSLYPGTPGLTHRRG